MKLVSVRSIQVDDVRFAVITDMMFNLGYKGLSKFKNMLAALQSEDYVTAAREMLNSKWRTQVGKRAEKLAEMMETGRW
jgi:lysozyme